MRQIFSKDYWGGIKAAFNGTSYESAISTRFRNYYAQNRSRDVTEDRAMGSHGRKQTRLECRDLYRNDPIVHGAVTRFVDFTVASGIWPQAQTSDPEWNEIAESWWRDIYVPTADYRQLPGVDLVTLQGQTISHRIVEGGLGFIMMANGQIQPVEEGLIATPHKFRDNKNVQYGVKTGPGGIVLGYFVCERADKTGPVDQDKFKFVPRENFIYCPNLGRVAQYRGIPDLASAVPKLRDYAETSEYVLNKVKIDGEQQFKRFTRDGGYNSRNRDATVWSNSSSKDPQRVEKTSWGRVHNLMPNEDMESFSSNTPNSEYVNFMEHELRAIASCLGISYEYMMLIFTQGSYSSQRMALLASKRTFVNYHDWLVKTMMQRLWNWRIGKAMKAGDLPLAPLDDQGRSQWYRVAWSAVHMDTADPAKEHAATLGNYKMGLTSLKAEARSRGLDRDEILRDKADDIAAAERIAADKGVDAALLIQTGVPGEPTGSAAEGGPADDFEANARKRELEFKSLKAKYDAYGVGVRAGAITPQPEDESSFREESDLPGMSAPVQEAWEEDGGVRRPITLQQKGGKGAPPAGNPFDDSDNDDDTDDDADEDRDE